MGRFLSFYATVFILVGGFLVWLFAVAFGPQDQPSPTQAVAGTLTATRTSEQPPIDLSGLGPSPLPLSMPIACNPGKDCWVLKYVDLDPSKGRRDYECGEMTVDGHKGTDIAIADRSRLNHDEVPVLAAAPGKVVGIRDEMPDVNIRIAGRESLKGRDCGNGVRIDHGGGWASQYCHMKRGSIAVKPGQTVASGDKLGFVGLSGSTEFLHLHVQFEKDGKVVDPFVGLGGSGESCGLGKEPLWKPSVLQKLRYSAPLIDAAGILGEVPDGLGISEGKYDHPDIPKNAPLLVLWADMYGLRKGDKVSMRFTDPDGKVIAERDWTIKEPKLRTYQYIGKKSHADWAPGTYRGVVEVRHPAGSPGKSETRETVEYTLD